MTTMEAISPLHERILAAVGDRTYRRMGELTGTHPETVRRYLQGQSPSVEFVAALCNALGVSGQWLLTGEGAMRSEDATTHALEHADPSDLLAAIAATLETLGQRVERLEFFVQQLEVRVRGKAKPKPAGESDGGQAADHRNAGGEQDGQLVEPRGKARSIGRAVAKRPRPDAG